MRDCRCVGWSPQRNIYCSPHVWSPSLLNLLQHVACCMQPLFLSPRGGLECDIAHLNIKCSSPVYKISLSECALHATLHYSPASLSSECTQNCKVDWWGNHPDSWATSLHGVTPTTADKHFANMLHCYRSHSCTLSHVEVTQSFFVVNTYGPYSHTCYFSTTETGPTYPMDAGTILSGANSSEEG